MVTKKINLIWLNPDTKHKTQGVSYNFNGDEKSLQEASYEEVCDFLNKRFPPWVVYKWWNDGEPEPYSSETWSLWDYMTTVVDNMDTYKDWRKGQTYFNVLRDMRPDLSEAILGSIYDPFNNNDKINDFLFFVVSCWEKPTNTQYNIVEWMKQNKIEVPS